MAENTYNLNGLYKLRSESGQSTLQFNCFNGNTSLAVFRGEFGSGNKPTSITINAVARKMLIDIMTEVLKGAPGSKQPLIFKKWNNDIKKREVANILTVGKDENNVIYIEVKAGNNAPEKFPLKGDKNLERSAEVDSDGSRSKTEAEALLAFMRIHWETASLLSRFNMTPMSYGGKKGGGNNYSAPQATAAMDSGDDSIY